MNATHTDLLRFIRSIKAKQAAGSLSDRQLLETFVNHRLESSFAALVQRHGAMVIGVCRRLLRHTHDAEDAFQATFLTLARRAASIRQHEALGSWLHGVAYHIATTMKRAAARRAVHEGRLPPPPPADPLDDITWRELRSALDEELQRLPEQYRAPLVLCYLEARTQDEAARHLGWSKSTFGRRINRARQMLAQRLTRRGLTLPAALTAPLLIDSAAHAAVSPLLAGSTVRAGLVAAMGNTANGIVSAQVMALAESGTASLLSKKASVALVLLMSMMFGVGGLVAHRNVHSRTFADAPPPPPPPPARSTSKEQAIEIQGRVLDPDGKPVAGARLFLLTEAKKAKRDGAVRAATDKDGRFSFKAKPPDFNAEGKATLAATAKGFGPDWIEVKSANKDAVTLRLVKDDVPIEGRVLDLEGQPIAGVTVRAIRLRQGNLDSWLDAAVKGRFTSLKSIGTEIFGEAIAATSGKDGRFRLTGFGRDRVVYIQVRGERIENSEFDAVTRREVPAELRKGLNRVYPAAFDYLVGPGKFIRGAVRDKRSGKPLEGITVVCPMTSSWIGATTDEQGRYRLTGVGKRRTYALAAEGMPYFNVTKFDIADTPSLDPVTVDFEMDRGIPLRVRAIDKATGKRVRGQVTYFARIENPHLKDYPRFGRGLTITPFPPNNQPADGIRTVLAIPGPGFLCFDAEDQDRYIGFELKNWDGFLLRALPDGRHPSQFHAVVPIDVAEKDAKSTTIDIVLEPGRARTGTVVGPDGKPLAGAHVVGLTSIPHFLSRNPMQRVQSKGLPTATFTALGLNPRKARNIVFFHPEKKLGKVQEVRGDETGPLTVRLEPLGGVSGRILDASGRPWAGLTVRATLTRLIVAYKDLPWELLENLGPTMEVRATTDGEGKFRIDGLLPGLRYNLAATDGEIKVGTPIAAHRADVAVESGRVKDLGDLKGMLVPEKEAKEKP